MLNVTSHRVTACASQWAVCTRHRKPTWATAKFGECTFSYNNKDTYVRPRARVRSCLWWATACDSNLTLWSQRRSHVRPVTVVPGKASVFPCSVLTWMCLCIRYGGQAANFAAWSYEDHFMKCLVLHNCKTEVNREVSFHRKNFVSQTVSSFVP